MPSSIITAAHGGGGSGTREVIELIRRYLDNPVLSQSDDGACIDIAQQHLVFTTDSYVIYPLEFPGGDIGRLAVCGTVNDIAMQAGVPRFLSLSFILEEGLEFTTLQRIISSIAAAAEEAGVEIATGDTKVVEHGKAGGIYINTSGIGVRNPLHDVHVKNARPGDAVIVTGSLGDHGIAVMNAREDLGIRHALKSDVTPLHAMASKVLERSPEIHCMRDLTRGGLSAALCDIAEASQTGIEIDERSLVVKRQVHGACALLGLDVMSVANEGKALLVCPEADTDSVVAACRETDAGREATCIGTIVADHPGTALVHTREGGERLVDMPAGENLPRIC